MSRCVCGARAKYDSSCLRCLASGRHVAHHGNYASSPRLWSHNVQTHYHPPAGLFTKSAEQIARELLHGADSPGQAIRRLQFYINRAGRNLSDKDGARLHHAMRLLQQQM